MAGYVTEIILLFLGGVLLVRGLPGVAQLIRAQDWQQVPGRILGAGVARYQTQAGAGHMSANMQRAAFAYSYQIDSTGEFQPSNAAPYLDRNRIDPGMLHDGDPAVRVFTDRGWRWGGDWRTPKDYQHFERRHQ